MARLSSEQIAKIRAEYGLTPYVPSVDDEKIDGILGPERTYILSFSGSYEPVSKMTVEAIVNERKETSREIRR